MSSIVKENLTTVYVWPMKVVDYKEIAAIWKAAKLGPRKGEDKEWFANILGSNGHFCFTAKEDHAIVGTIMGGFDGFRGWVYRLAVKEGYKKNGIGRILIHHLEDIFKGLGVKQVNVSVRENQLSSVGFYEHLGYKTSTAVLLYQRFED